MLLNIVAGLFYILIIKVYDCFVYKKYNQAYFYVDHIYILFINLIVFVSFIN